MKYIEIFVDHITKTYGEGGLIVGTIMLIIESALIAFFGLLMVYVGICWAWYWVFRALFGKNVASGLLSVEGRRALHGA